MFSTGTPCSYAMRTLMPVPPLTAPPRVRTDGGVARMELSGGGQTAVPRGMVGARDGEAFRERVRRQRAQSVPAQPL